MTDSRQGPRVFYDSDADRTRLKDRTFAIIGYGSQGHAHALNLKESGAKVIVGLRPGGASWTRAKAAGLDVRSVAEAAQAAAPVDPIDGDGDGLEDTIEAELGTDPFDIDTDDDGATDGDEYYVHQTGTRNPDNDGDGVLDGDEVANGTNPHDPNSF